MAAGKRPIVDLTEDEPPPKRRFAGGSEAQPIDLDSDDDGAVVPSASSIAAPSASSAAAPSASSAAVPSVLAGEWLRPSGEVTCPICMCETPPVETAVLRACSHAFCEDCITQYVQGKVTEGQVLPEQLRCPSVDPKCSEMIVPADVARCLKEPSAIARYERLTLQRCVEADDGLGSCPTAGCPFMFAYDQDNRKLECPLCAKSFCLVCRVEPWHTGVRCETYQAEHGNVEEADKLFSSFASQQRLKQCPKCKFFVEKTEGCDAMHCRCNLVFCYKCGGVLKASGGLKRCDCRGMAPYLAAHEGAPNINNMPQFAGGAPAGGAGLPAAALAAVHAMMNAAGGRFPLPGRRRRP